MFLSHHNPSTWYIVYWVLRVSLCEFKHLDALKCCNAIWDSSTIHPFRYSTLLIIVMTMMMMMCMARVIDVSMDFLALTEIFLYFQLHRFIQGLTLMYVQFVFYFSPSYIFIYLFSKNESFYLFLTFLSILVYLPERNIVFAKECLLPYRL